MTIGKITPQIDYTYSGPGNYSFPFEIIEETDLEVIGWLDSDVAMIFPLVLNTDYTVTILPDRTGSIDTTLADYIGTLRINRKLEIDQPTDWVNNEYLDMEVLEEGMDRQTMAIQQQQVITDRVEASETIVLQAEAARDAAQTSETNAATSETNAATSETNAAISETNADLSWQLIESAALDAGVIVRYTYAELLAVITSSDIGLVGIATKDETNSNLRTAYEIITDGGSGATLDIANRRTIDPKNSQVDTNTVSIETHTRSLPAVWDVDYSQYNVTTGGGYDDSTLTTGMTFLLSPDAPNPSGGTSIEIDSASAVALKYLGPDGVKYDLLAGEFNGKDLLVKYDGTDLIAVSGLAVPQLEIVISKSGSYSLYTPTYGSWVQKELDTLSSSELGALASNTLTFNGPYKCAVIGELLIANGNGKSGIEQSGSLKQGPEIYSSGAGYPCVAQYANSLVFNNGDTLELWGYFRASPAQTSKSLNALRLTYLGRP